MSNLWKALIVVAVIIIIAIIIVPKMVGQTPDANNTEGTSTNGDSSSLASIEKTVKNGKPTLLLLRSST